MRTRLVSAAIALTAALALTGIPDVGTPTTAAPREPNPTTAAPREPNPTTAPLTSAPPIRPVTTTAVEPAPVKEGPATLSVTSSTSAAGRVTILATSDAKSLQVRYRTSTNARRTTTEMVRRGAAQVSLDPGATSIRVRARATSTLTASPWVAVSSAPDPLPSPGATYWVSPSSRILGKTAGFRTVNRYTRDYYLIRSYMQMFEARGGGTLVLGPGRYEISSTIYVPSNTTIRLSEGTTLVKGQKTATKRFSASDSMFMLIRPSWGKKRGAVGGHNGASGITIAGAGHGLSIIDMANAHNALAIISGHNRDVTISGITFTHMNNNHFIEMDGCADCTISGNEFLDAARGTRETAEAINLDTPDPRTDGFGSVWSKQDSTPNERVTISSNRFDGLERALGTHNFSPGSYHSDIVVTGNTITSNADDAIHIMNWANPVFTGNTITSPSGSAGIRACGTTNPTITGNTFAESGTAVVFRSCRGEHGTIRANSVTEANAAALGTNLVSGGTGRESVAVPGHGTVTFDGAEPPAPGAPSQPLVESVVAGDGRLTVRWTPALADDRAPITAYRVRVHTDPEADAVQTIEAPADSTEAVITGLANGTAHHVTVAAVNDTGASPTGSWCTFTETPMGPPSAPRDVLVASLVPGTLSVSWTPPANDSGERLTEFHAHIYSDPGAAEPLPGSPVALHADTRGHEWSGLTEGRSYYVHVTASTALGEGAPSELTTVVVNSRPVIGRLPREDPRDQGSSSG